MKTVQSLETEPIATSVAIVASVAGEDPEDDADGGDRIVSDVIPADEKLPGV